MKTRTQMHRGTMKLRSRENTSISLTSGERLHQLKVSLFLTDRNRKRVL